MRKSALFSGTLVVLVGIILLAVNLGVVGTAIWSFFWPLVLILLGIWFIAAPHQRKGEIKAVGRSILLENETQAEIHFNYGAGVMVVEPSDKPGELIGGTFVGGITDDVKRSGGKVFVKLSPPSESIYAGSWFYHPQGINWTVGVTKEIPLNLNFHTGACEAKLDLVDLQVSELTLETGASSTEVHLPKNAGFTRMVVKSGAAAVRIFIPQGVSATIRESSGLSGINIDTNRFLQNGHTYQSIDYETAANKVDISYEGGVGSVEIK
ncbi:MAG: hypothetical protein NTZ74_13355 [Chloroflexi bacterium]|nr:hypothetical protein [Chloroflexota bacterium]